MGSNILWVKLARIDELLHHGVVNRQLLEDVIRKTVRS